MGSCLVCGAPLKRARNKTCSVQCKTILVTQETDERRRRIPPKICKCGCGGLIYIGKRQAESRFKSQKYLPRHGAMKGVCSGGNNHQSPFGKGRMAIDREDHATAKSYAFRDPTGRLHTMTNLSKWCRKNVGLFYDDHAESIMPFWKRIHKGLSRLGSCDGQATSYKGWTIALSDVEVFYNDAKDLLERSAR